MQSDATVYTGDGKVQVLNQRPRVGFRIGSAHMNRRFLKRVIDNTFLAASSSEGFMTSLLKSWVDAGCRYDRWKKANPDAHWKLAHAHGWGLDNWRVIIPDRQDGRTEPYVVGVSGFEREAPEKANGDELLAFEIFALFIIAAAPRAKVGLCGYCGKFYWNRWGHTNSRFCSRKHSQLQTAKEGQARKLRTKRQERNARIENAITDYFKTVAWDKADPPDWKAWVADRANVTRSYLTRAYNRGLRGEADGLKLTKAQIKSLESRRGSHHASL